MLKTLLLRSLWIGFCFVGMYPTLAQTTQTLKRGTQVKPTQPKVELARWSADLEKSFGISQEKFAAMGLSKLTVLEYTEMLFWAASFQKSAEEKGREEARATQLRHSCGRSIEDRAATDKVNVLINPSKDSNSEIVSGLRQRLRGIPDVQIVYAEKDADLALSILASETRLKDNRAIGYDMTVTITVPCREWFGTNQAGSTSYDRFEGQVFSGGGKVAEVVEPAVAELDAKYIEEVRKSHALWREALSKVKK